MIAALAFHGYRGVVGSCGYSSGWSVLQICARLFQQLCKALPRPGREEPKSRAFRPLGLRV